MKRLAVGALALVLAACSSHALRCQGRLTPINLPATASAQANTPPTEHGAPGSKR